MANDFLQGSFRGVEFLWEARLTTTEGRRLQEFEFPNSDKRYVQDKGYSQPKFTMTLVVSGRTFEEYQGKLNALRNALNERGAGKLIHPTQGEHFVRVGVYTLDEGQDTYLKATLQVEFIEERSERLFLNATYTPQEVQTVALVTLNSLQGTYVAQYPTPRTTALGFNMVRAIFKNIYSIVRGATTYLTSRLTTQAADTYDLASNTSPNNPTTGASSLATMFTTIYDDEEDMDALADFYASFFGITDDTPEFIFARVNDTKKMQLTNQYAESAAWLLYVATLAQKDYYTSEEIDADVARALAQYERISAMSLGVYHVTEYDVVLSALLETLNETKAIVFSEATYTLPTQSSLTHLIYSAYGDLDRMDDIREVNQQRARLGLDDMGVLAQGRVLTYYLPTESTT